MYNKPVQAECTSHYGFDIDKGEVNSAHMYMALGTGVRAEYGARSTQPHQKELTYLTTPLHQAIVLIPPREGSGRAMYDLAG